MKYNDLKTKLHSYLAIIQKEEPMALEFLDLNKKDILIDLTRFMVFIEELEQKEKNKEMKKSDAKKQLLMIKEYLNELEQILD